jgi:hypothetical protein
MLREDPQTFLVSRREVHDAGGVTVRLPSTIVATPARRDPYLAVPIAAGFIDALALRAGDLLALQVGATKDGEALPLVLDPTLRREVDAVPAEVPAAFVRRFVARGGAADSLRAFHLRRNGEDVAIVVQRSLGNDTAIAWIAAPPAALVRTPELHAAILADAVPSAGGVVHGAREVEVEGRDAAGVVRPQ